MPLKRSKNDSGGSYAWHLCFATSYAQRNTQYANSARARRLGAGLEAHEAVARSPQEAVVDGAPLEVDAHRGLDPPLAVRRRAHDGVAAVRAEPFLAVAHQLGVLLADLLEAQPPAEGLVDAASGRP